MKSCYWNIVLLSYFNFRKGLLLYYSICFLFTATYNFLDIFYFQVSIYIIHIFLTVAGQVSRFAQNVTELRAKRN